MCTKFSGGWERPEKSNAGRRACMIARAFAVTPVAAHVARCRELSERRLTPMRQTLLSITQTRCTFGVSLNHRRRIQTNEGCCPQSDASMRNRKSPHQLTEPPSDVPRRGLNHTETQVLFSGSLVGCITRATGAIKHHESLIRAHTWRLGTWRGLRRTPSCATPPGRRSRCSSPGVHRALRR